MGKLGGALSNMKNIGEADLGDLSPQEKMLRAGAGGLAGGLQGMKQQQPQGGSVVTPMLPQPQYVDFSQITPGFRQRSNFFGG